MIDQANVLDIVKFLERIKGLISAGKYDFGSVDISNYSHNEKGYCETKQGEIIPYNYANI